MKSTKFYTATTFALSLLLISPTMYAQHSTLEGSSLSEKQQNIVVFSAFTAQGDLEQLPVALNDGLEAGLTINETKEMLVHLYAYCGFPRSIRGLQTLMAVVEDRQAKGIRDEVGREATPLNAGNDKYEQGKQVLEELTGRPQDGPTEVSAKKGYAEFSPIIEVFLKEHLFADIFGRDILSYTERDCHDRRANQHGRRGADGARAYGHRAEHWPHRSPTESTAFTHRNSYRFCGSEGQ